MKRRYDPLQIFPEGDISRHFPEAPAFFCFCILFTFRISGKKNSSKDSEGPPLHLPTVSRMTDVWRGGEAHQIVRTGHFIEKMSRGPLVAIWSNGQIGLPTARYRPSYHPPSFFLHTSRTASGYQNRKGYLQEVGGRRDYQSLKRSVRTCLKIDLETNTEKEEIIIVTADPYRAPFLNYFSSSLGNRWGNAKANPNQISSAYDPYPYYAGVPRQLLSCYNIYVRTYEYKLLRRHQSHHPERRVLFLHYYFLTR